MFKFKKGEAYIDTVVTIFLSMTVIAVSLNLFSYYTAYHRLDFVAQEMLRGAAMQGETTSAELAERYQELLENTGLGNQDDGSLGYGKTGNMSISFEGSEVVFSPSNTTGAVQMGDVIKVKVSCTAHINFMGQTGVAKIPMTVTKTGLSECFWKTTESINY